MDSDKLAEYDKATREGHYLDGLDIVLRANAPEGITDEELYAPIMDAIFWWRKPTKAAPGGIDNNDPT